MARKARKIKSQTVDCDECGAIVGVPCECRSRISKAKSFKRQSPQGRSGGTGYRLQQTRVLSPDVKRRMRAARRAQPVTTRAATEEELTKTRRLDPYAVVCPTCAATVGVRCHNEDGPMRRTHDARFSQASVERAHRRFDS